MKQFEIIVSANVYACVVVEAETEEDAIDKFNDEVGLKNEDIIKFQDVHVEEIYEVGKED